MLQSRLLFFPLMAVSLFSCTSYHSKDINPGQSRLQLENRSLSDPGLRQLIDAHGIDPTSEWDLESLTLAAFYFSPDLDIARARLAQSEAGVRAAGALPNPAFDFTPGYNQDAIGGVTPWIFGYGLSLPLEVAGKRSHRTAEAQWSAEAARLDIAVTAWQIRKAVSRALTDLHAAESAANIWRIQVPLRSQAAQLVQTQVEVGEVSPLEAARAGIALNQAILAARESERATTLARGRLAEEIGVPLASLSGIRFSHAGLGEALSLPDLAESRAWAAQNRADLLSKLASYAASQSALQLEIARQYPDLGIGPGYQLDQGEGKWSLSLGINLPVFNQNQGPIAVALARRETAAAEFLALQHRVLAEVDRAHADCAATFDDLAIVKEMRGILDQQEKTVKVQETVGEATLLDITRAQLERADNTRAELQARIRVERAFGNFEDAVQRPFSWPEAVWRNDPRPTAGNR